MSGRERGISVCGMYNLLLCQVLSPAATCVRRFPPVSYNRVDNTADTGLRDVCVNARISCFRVMYFILCNQYVLMDISAVAMLPGC